MRQSIAATATRLKAELADSEIPVKERPVAPKIESSKTPEEASLIRRLNSFATGHRFQRDFDVALSEFFQQPARLLRDIGKKDPVAYDRFLQWFAREFVLSGGKKLVEEFAIAKGPNLPPAERDILNAVLTKKE